MGAMSMTFRGTVEVVERDDDAHRAVLRVKSKDTGGQGYANADVRVHARRRRRRRSTPRRRSAARPRRWARASCSRARRADQGLHDEAGDDLMAERMVMRRVREGEVPPDGGTALQDDPDRPVFRGNGPYDYVCVECGNVLAAAMGLEHDDQARADQVRALQDRQRRRLRRQGRDVTAFGSRHAQGGRALHPRPGPLRRRRAAARDAARRGPALAGRARARSSRSTSPPRSSTRRCTP